MHVVAKLPRINPGTALTNPDLVTVLPEQDKVRFQSLSTADLWHLEHKYDVYLDRCFGAGRFKLASQMRGLVILNWREKQGGCRMLEVELEQRPELLGAVMKSPGLFYLPLPGRQVESTPQAYLKALANCPVYELVGSPDFAEATRLCLEILHQARHDEALPTAGA